MGLFLTVKVDPAESVGTLMQMNATLRVTGDVPNSPNDDQSVNALVIDPSELSSQDDDGVVSGPLEVASGYTRQGETCSAESIEGTELALFGWGDSELLVRTKLSAGRLGEATDETGREVCVFDFKFDGVPDLSVFMVSYLPVGDTVPCWTCTLGLVTHSDNAQQVIVWSPERADGNVIRDY